MTDLEGIVLAVQRLILRIVLGYDPLLSPAYLQTEIPSVSHTSIGSNQQDDKLSRDIARHIC